MTTAEEIKQFFQDLNLVISDGVLAKCLEICTGYNIEAEDFVDQWFAYSTSHLNGAPPTIDELVKMERKEYQKQNKESARKPVTTPKSVAYKNTTDNTESSALVNSVSEGTPKVNKRLPVNTPEQPRRLQATTLNYESGDISNIYGSPAQTKSQSNPFNSRTDSGKVQCSHGPPTAEFKRTDDLPLTIEIVGDDEKNVLTSSTKYMYETVGTKAKCLNSMTERLGNKMLTEYGMTLSGETLKNHTGQMTTFGRIVSDSDGKLNAQSILLEGTRSLNGGHTVKLNLNKLSTYSLFPGQIAVVEGNNTHTGVFIVDTIITDPKLSLPMETPSLQDNMQVVIASGPFTLPSNIFYEPLNDILKYVSEHKPHLLILVGPFLQKDHEGIHNGQLTQTFDEFFENTVNVIMSTVPNDVQVIIVASSKDAHHHPVYPTPPYKTRETYSNLMFFPDPCLINVNGIIIGATSVDVLMHMSNVELYQNKHQGTTDRLGRLVSNILNQQCFYPLFPPVKDMVIDHGFLEEYGVFNATPHVLILPSTLRHFIKNIHGCLVINPERATKGHGAGTFAHLEINSGSSNTIYNRSACKILRV